jgi:hypothetical protein
MSHVGPDFSKVTSRERAEELVRAGQMEPPLLLPPMFGGRADIPENVVYVPVGFVEVKRGIDENIVAPLARDGQVSRYAAEPRYSGDSFIPVEITIAASDPGSFTTRIAIWGDALA